MITRSVIHEIYRQCSKRPGCADDIDVALLFDPNISAYHSIYIDNSARAIVIADMGAESMMRSIPLDHVFGIIPFERWVAIVLRSAILFIDKTSPQLSMHLAPERPGLWQRLARCLRGR